MHENTPEFNHELLVQLLGDIYVEVSSCVVGAVALGTACERDRRLTWLIHKKEINFRVPDAIPWGDHWLEMFHRQLQTCWEEFFDQGSEAERMVELVWAQERPESRGKGHNVSANMNFEVVFNEQEVAFLDGYLKKPDGPGSVASLMQDPGERATYNRQRSTLNTLIKNNFPQYSTKHHKWLLPRETLTANLIPAYHKHAFYGVAERPYTWRSRNLLELC